MLKIYTEILDENRKKILPLLSKLPKGGVLGGGTALASQIGHRISYDFDFFYSKPIPKNWLIKIKKLFGDDLIRAAVDTSDELTVLIKPDIKITLLFYPFTSQLKPRVWKNIKLMRLEDIASAKAYAVGRRGVWRDYVDLYFLLRDHLSLAEIIKQSERRFKGIFDARMFLEQLTYEGDLEDQIVQFTGEKINKKTVMDFMKMAVSDFTRKM
ncbi:MAG: nucleotidyl transferase AbiEii/AbiGii toxin family protein [Patescibacteria group bacterium]|jgi:hypothetical protein